MHLMVYAPYGRTGVYMLQGTAAGSVSARRQVTSANSPARSSRCRVTTRCRHSWPSRRFRTADALADTLLNPRDRVYSVPQLFEFIEGAGLEFRRWFRQAPYLPQCGAMAASPHHARLSALPAPEQYAAVELWRGSMVRHSPIVGLKATPGARDPA